MERERNHSHIHGTKLTHTRAFTLMTRLLGVAYKHNAYKWIYRGTQSLWYNILCSVRSRRLWEERERERCESNFKCCLQQRLLAAVVCSIALMNDLHILQPLLVLSGSLLDLSSHSLVGNIIKLQLHFWGLVCWHLSLIMKFVKMIIVMARDRHIVRVNFFRFGEGLDISLVLGQMREMISCRRRRRGGKIGVKSLPRWTSLRHLFTLMPAL